MAGTHFWGGDDRGRRHSRRSDHAMVAIGSSTLGRPPNTGQPAEGLEHLDSDPRTVVVGFEMIGYGGHKKYWADNN